VVAGPVPGPIEAAPVAAMVGLGALGSGIAFALNYRVIREAGSSNASMVTYLTPLFAVIVGSAFLGESIVWYEPVGAVLVLFGVAIAQGRFAWLPGRAGMRPRMPRQDEPAGD